MPKLEKIIVIDTAWHANRVAMHKDWIEGTKEQIAWHEEQMRLTKEHLAKEEQWLADALHDQEEFLKGK